VVNYGQSEMNATSFVRTKTNQEASAASQVQGGTRFSHVQQRTKRKKKTYFHKTKTQTREKVLQHSFKNARWQSFCTMKNPTTKNNPDSFLEVTLS